VAKILFSAPLDFSPWVKQDIQSAGATEFRVISESKDLKYSEDTIAWVCNPSQHFVINVAVLELFPNLKIIVSPSTGTNHIDIPACHKKGVRVRSLLDDRKGLDRIAASSEFAFMLLLTMFKRPPRRELYEKQVGIVGLGRIGGNVKRYCEVFGARVLFHDPYVKGGVPLTRLFKQADAVVVCCTFGESTRGLINSGLLAMLKPGAVFVNVSRGEVVDEEALIVLAHQRKDLKIALDVVSGLVQGTANYGKLVDAGIYVTPHIAGATVESRTKAAKIACGLLKQELKRAWVS
jgi:D-3-phosphoglycerate dehydrogenase